MVFHSSFEYSYLFLPVVGFAIGMLASMIGGGGGFFFLLVLILLFNVPAQIAVATSLAATLPICIVGTMAHYRHGHIDLRMGFSLALAGIVGALLGAFLTRLMTNEQLRISFGIYLILLAINMRYIQWRRARAKARGSKLSGSTRVQKMTKGSVYGFLAGIITGTFGTSGTAPVLAGLLAIRMPVKLVVGTSLMVVLVNTVSALTGHFLVGKIDLTLVSFLASGAIIGAVSGPRVLAGVTIGKAEGPIRNWYALAMVIFGMVMIINTLL